MQVCSALHLPSNAPELFDTNWTYTYPISFVLYHKQQLVVSVHCLTSLSMTTPTTVSIKFPTLKQPPGKAVIWRVGYTDHELLFQPTDYEYL